MNNDIRESLARLTQIPPTSLDAANGELTTLLGALRKEIESRSGALHGPEVTHTAFTVAADDLTVLLQLANVVIQTKTELGKLETAATKAIQRVWKKAPK
jgi:hypothetical protein